MIPSHHSKESPSSGMQINMRQVLVWMHENGDAYRLLVRVEIISASLTISLGVSSNIRNKTTPWPNYTTPDMYPKYFINYYKNSYNSCLLLPHSQ